jgi:hypothetical protein
MEGAVGMVEEEAKEQIRLFEVDDEGEAAYISADADMGE